MSTKDMFCPFLVGEHIYLREVRPNDVNENYYRWMNDPEVTQYLASRSYPSSMESLLEYVEDFQGNKNNIFLASVLKENHKHIGNIKMGPINWLDRLADIGIIIGAKNSWGKGYATEAISLMADFAFSKLNLHKLTAGCVEQNQGSLKAFQKAGFEIEGIRKKHRFLNGEYVDSILLGRICHTEKSDDEDIG